MTNQPPTTAQGVTPELKPCPFCGGTAVGVWKYDSREWHVGCENGECGSAPVIAGGSKRRAITRWNRRAAASLPDTPPNREMIDALVRDAKTNWCGFTHRHALDARQEPAIDRLAELARPTPPFDPDCLTQNEAEAYLLGRKSASAPSSAPPTPEQFMAYGEHHDSCVIWREGTCDCGFAELYRAAEKIAGPQLHIEQVRSSAPQEPVAWRFRWLGHVYPNDANEVFDVFDGQWHTTVKVHPVDTPDLWELEPLYLASLPASPTAPPLESREAVREALTKLADEHTLVARVKRSDILGWRDREYPSLPASAEQPT